MSSRVLRKRRVVKIPSLLSENHLQNGVPPLCFPAQKEELCTGKRQRQRIRGQREGGREGPALFLSPVA